MIWGWHSVVNHEELHDLYLSSTIVRVIKSRLLRTGHVAGVGKGRGVYRVLVGKPGGKRPLGRPRHRWDDNIKRIFRKWDVHDWIELAQDRNRWRALVIAVMNLRVP
jgi:hypothetical protein